MGVNIGQAFVRSRTGARLLFPLLTLFLSFLAGCATPRGTAPLDPVRARHFDPVRDTLAFANDTVREYAPDASGKIVTRPRPRGEKPAFSHGCFLLARGVMQFAQFARFDPAAPPLPQEEYRRRLKKLFRIPVWFSGNREKLVFPGYADLHAFSAAHKGLIEEEIGHWIWSYFRVGNYRMVFPFPRSGQALAARRLVLALDRGELQAVYLARFPHMNHCVVLYDYKPQAGGDIKFLLYDPNYPAQPSWMLYHARGRYFELEKRWYFNAGRVNLMRVYLSPFH